MIHFKRRALFLLTAALLAEHALADDSMGDSVQLPYTAPSDSGNQWIVYYQGQLQQQGNQQTWQQAGMINVNGRTPQNNNQTGTLDEKTKELVINFNPISGLSHTRRFKFDEQTGAARIIDVFTNTGARETNVRINLINSVNFGVPNAQMVEDPKNKKSQIAWIGDTGNGRAAMAWLAGKGAKVVPNMGANRNGGNQFTASLNFKIAAKETAAIVHFYGTFDSSDEASKFVLQSRESQLLADVPNELRKQIINIGTIGTTLGNFELLRGDNADVVELRGGDKLRGKITLPTYALQTAYGPVSLPADKVLGVLSVGDFKPRQVVVTKNGEIFGGTMTAAQLPVQLTSGSSTSVPLSQIARVGFATPNPEQTIEFDLTKPMVFLRTGERALIAPPSEPITFVTRFGTLQLPPDKVAIVVLRTAAGTQEVYLTDGSRLVGILPRQSWTLNLTSTQDRGGVAFPTAAIARVQLAALPEDVGSGQPTLSLIGGDVVVARLDGQMMLTTSFDTLAINAAEIRSISRPDESAPDVQVTTADGSILRGTLAAGGATTQPTEANATTQPAAAELTATVAGDVKLSFPVAAVREYFNPRPRPGAARVKQVEEVLAKLDADDWKARETAEATLAAFGPSVLAVLEDAAGKQSPEAQQRLSSVIAKLKKQQPAEASRLPAPPELE